jgi:hypothetical protein
LIPAKEIYKEKLDFPIGSDMNKYAEISAYAAKESFIDFKNVQNGKCVVEPDVSTLKILPGLEIFSVLFFDDQVGDCTNEEIRFFYDPDAKQCLDFTYGGCSGNLNNYKTFDDCMKTCSDDIPLFYDFDDKPTTAKTTTLKY